ncbi:MAG: signal peptidase I [Promethearchaeota archaeon]
MICFLVVIYSCGDFIRDHTKKSIIVFVIFFLIFSPFMFLFILKFTLSTSQPIAVVKSDSMKPYINKGDAVIIKGIKNDTIIKAGSIENKDGDVIVFNAAGLWDDAPEESIVHRVVGKWKNGSEWFYLTKGDANEVVDKRPIPRSRVDGIVKVIIRYVGWGKIILMEISFILQLFIFSLLMSLLINRFRHLKF